jgi:NAD(P)-dependent dehydrogenase (short-subunit alcohol dehydrogenase family)
MIPRSLSGHTYKGTTLKLSGQVADVTCGSRGLAEAVSERLLREGTHLVINPRDEATLVWAVLCCRPGSRSCVANGHSKIIAVSGGGATRPTPRFSACAASRATVVRFAEILAEELAGTAPM